MEETTPVQNIFLDATKETSQRFIKVFTRLLSWHRFYPQVDINRVASKTRAFAVLMQNPPLCVKILGSGSNRTHIWVLNIEGREYIVFLSKEGLSVETLPGNHPDYVLQDLEELSRHIRLPATV